MIFRFKTPIFFSLFSSIFCIQNTFAGTVVLKNSCHSHFVQNDVLNTFTKAEKTSLETAARSLANLLGKSDPKSLQTKGDLNTSIQEFISSKNLNASEVKTLKLWLNERIQFYMNSQNESFLKSLNQKIREDQKQALTLKKQTARVQDNFQRLTQLLEKYNKAPDLSTILQITDASTSLSNPTKKQDIKFILTQFKELELKPEIFPILVKYNYLPAIKYFISKIVELNAKDRYENTALHYAAKNKKTAVFKLILQAGADPTVENKQGYLPLHLAAENPHMDAESIQLLLRNNRLQQINATTIFRKSTPLHFAVFNPNPEILKTLLDAGADVSIQDNIGRTALHMAVSIPEISHEIVQLLIEANHGALLNSREYLKGNTILHSFALRDSNPKIMELLIQAGYGAQVNYRNEKKQTPLHLATYNTIGILKAILDAGADPTLRDDTNKTPYELLQKMKATKYVVEKLNLLRIAMEERAKRSASSSRRGPKP